MATPLAARTVKDPKVRPEGFDARVGEKIEALVSVYGVAGLADLLRVSGAQPTKWRDGRERPNETTTRQVLGLEYLTARLAEVFTARQAQAWLAAPNPYLAGSSPAQVFTNFGSAAVEPAIAAVEVGAAV